MTQKPTRQTAKETLESKELAIHITQQQLGY
jgi:hypothetical protein